MDGRQLQKLLLLVCVCWRKGHKQQAYNTLEDV